MLVRLADTDFVYPGGILKPCPTIHEYITSNTFYITLIHPNTRLFLTEQVIVV
nr:MAG TPA_asm: hypothetical protein [Caudoviricetes sp.]DAX12459.1 MAG TPA: hypothetical protein [Caudoviricetes sp.]